ncbi:MAG: SDR family oxidoreductase, partial [Proteobacteria bacterium]|nr:SDR family oxidoreductase [Pseudomonadota bacterium]
MSLKGKVVLITGGSQGIGADLVEEFYKDGALVYYTGRDEEKLKLLLEKLKDIKNDGIIKYFVCDVTDSKSVEPKLGLILKQQGRIDILV